MAKKLPPPEDPNTKPGLTKPAPPQNKPSGISSRDAEKCLAESEPPSEADLLQRIDDFTNLWNDGSLAKPKDMELTPGILKLLVWAADDLSQAQHDQGMRNLVRNSQYWPNGAQYRAACLGVPVGSLNAAKAVVDDAIEVNRLWGWLVKWWSWLVEGHTYQLTIAAFSDHPVTYEFTDRSLNDGIEPYRACGVALEVARSTPSRALRKVTTLESQVLKLSERERTLGNQENVWRQAIERRRLQAEIASMKEQIAIIVDPYYFEGLDKVVKERQTFKEAIEQAKTEIEQAKAEIIAAPAALKKAEADFQLDKNDRLWCLLRVVMPPMMPPMLQEILEQLEGTIGAGLQSFARFMQSNDDPFLRAKFQKFGVQLIAAHEREASPLPPSRQLSGAVQSDHDPRVFSGVISFTSDDQAGYYSVEALREAQASGMQIADHDIEAQAVFIENKDEIWNAPYPPPLSQNGLA
jgi:hypothetical protein